MNRPAETGRSIARSILATSTGAVAIETVVSKLKAQPARRVSTRALISICLCGPWWPQLLKRNRRAFAGAAGRLPILRPGAAACQLELHSRSTMDLVSEPARPGFASFPSRLFATPTPATAPWSDGLEVLDFRLSLFDCGAAGRLTGPVRAAYPAALLTAPGEGASRRAG